MAVESPATIASASCCGDSPITPGSPFWVAAKVMGAIVTRGCSSRAFRAAGVCNLDFIRSEGRGFPSDESSAVSIFAILRVCQTGRRAVVTTRIATAKTFNLVIKRKGRIPAPDDAAIDLAVIAATSPGGGAEPL